MASDRSTRRIHLRSAVLGGLVVAGGGGVLANRRLRQRLGEEANAAGVELLLPAPELCTDNGAMIAAAANFWMAEGRDTPWRSDVDPGLRLA